MPHAGSIFWYPSRTCCYLIGTSAKSKDQCCSGNLIDNVCAPPGDVSWGAAGVQGACSAALPCPALHAGAGRVLLTEERWAASQLFASDGSLPAHWPALREPRCSGERRSELACHQASAHPCKPMKL